MFTLTAVVRAAATARVVLGLNDGQTYTPADIKKAFREKALTAHPDAGGDPEYFRQLQGAYEQLLREHGVSRNESSAAAEKESQGESGFGFYSHPHAQWANDRRSHRDYWQQVHDEEVNMNSNAHGSAEHPSNTHYRARSHRSTYGDGLGDDFTSASQAQRGSQANFSTFYFYRPYVSDYRTPYGTGFTEEEIQEAAREQRRGLFRTLARHTCLWSGIVLIVYLHERNNRVRRATEARDKGYQDPEYWQMLKAEEADARQHNRGPLRLENHWLEAPVYVPKSMDDAEKPQGAADLGNAAAGQRAVQDAQNAQQQQQQRRQRALRPALGGGGGGLGGPQVVSYKGRPFTPNGVRGARNKPPITAQTYANDVTYDVSDLDWEEDTLE